MSLAKGTDCYGQRLDTFDDADGTSGTRGLSPTTFAKWYISPETEKAVEKYLDSKSIAEQVALARFMREIELPEPRCRTTTDPMPWLQKPGAGRFLATEWAKKLGIAS